MQVHAPTVLLMLIIVCATLTISVGWVTRRRARDGLGFWAGGLALNTVAITLIVLRGVVPDFVSIAVSNTAISVAYVLFLMAVLQLQKRRVFRPWVWLPPLIILSTFSFLLSQTKARLLTIGVVFCIQYLLVLHAALSRRFSVKGRGKHLFALALVMMIAVLGIRTLAVALGVIDAVEVAQNQTVQIIFFVASLVSLIFASNGFLLMAKESSDEQVSLLARKDVLTEVWNRAHIEDMANQEIERFRRYGVPVAIIMIDLDHFKSVNDRFGHGVGDQVLRKFCAKVKESIRVSDILGRWGGEEFLLLLPNCNLDSAIDLAERIRIGVQKERFSGVGELTASFGVADFDPREDWDSWLDRADMALYRAKNEGRNRVIRAARPE